MDTYNDIRLIDIDYLYMPVQVYITQDSIPIHEVSLV